MPKQPRKFPRVLVEIPLEIRGEQLFKASGRDLTEEGVRVRAKGRLKQGDRVGVTLRIPGFANMDLNFSAEVRWAKLPEEGMECEAGLEFDLTPALRKKLQVLLWELQSGNVKEIERRMRTGKFPQPPKR